MRPVRRQLTDREKEILRFLLDLDAPAEHRATMTSLREQVDEVTVTERWDCCPTVELASSVDDPPPLGEAYPLVESWHTSEALQLILFVTGDGRLRSLELVHYDAERASVDDEIPPANEFGPPELSDVPPMISDRR